MSAVQALADIQNILVKYRISASVYTWYEEGTATTKIVIKDSAGFQPKPSPVKKKKKKNPSRILRDQNRRNDYAAKMTGSCRKDPGAAPAPPVPSTEEKASRRTATPGRRLGTDEKEEVRWQPAVGVDGSPENIPQLDGCGKKDVSSDGEDDEDESSAEEEDNDSFEEENDEKGESDEATESRDDDDEEECTDDNDSDDEACCPEGQCVCLPPEGCQVLEPAFIVTTKQQPLTPDEPPDNDCSLCSRCMEPGEAILACAYCHFEKCNECIRGAAVGQD